MSVRYRFCEKETKRKGRKLLSRSVFTPCWHSQEYFSQFILHNRKARFSLTHGLRMIRTSSSSSIHPCASKPPPKLVHMVCSLFFPPIPSKGRIPCASAYRLIEVIPASMQIAVRAVSLGTMGKIMHVQPSMRVPSFVLMPAINLSREVIGTPRDLLLGLRSLSQALFFRAFLKAITEMQEAFLGFGAKFLVGERRGRSACIMAR